jgi:hypothetical protein
MHGMPRQLTTRLEFRFVANQTLQYHDDGTVGVTPDLTESARMYIIHNPRSPRPYYIGTGASRVGGDGNLRRRLQDHFEACYELGFSLDEVTHIRIFTIEVVVDDRWSETPDLLGRVPVWTLGEMINVQHLLIRTFAVRFRVLVRNMTDAPGSFQNRDLGERRLRWQLTDRVGVGFINGHQVHGRTFELAPGEFF